MKCSIKKYQKSSLTLISIALLSASSLTQATQEWNDSTIKLCGQYVDWSDGSTSTEIEASQSMLREDLRKQAYVSIRSSTMGYHLEPRYLTDTAYIFPPVGSVVSAKSEKIKQPGEFYVLSDVLIRSFNLEPENFLIGRTEISAPGVHIVNQEHLRLGDLPVNELVYSASCKTKSL